VRTSWVYGHPTTRTGIVHFADYGEVPAKKVWSFGVDAEGLDWRKALSDDNSGYIEIQGGLFRNQETYAFLEPRHTIHFSEYWMPVREIGGISRANLAGVLDLERRAILSSPGFNANQAIRSCQHFNLEWRENLISTKRLISLPNILDSRASAERLGREIHT